MPSLKAALPVSRTSERSKLGKHFTKTLSVILNRASKSITGYLARPAASDYSE